MLERTHSRWHAVVPAAIVALGLGASGPAAAGDAALNTAVQRFANQVINARDVGAVDRVFTKDYRQHTPQARNLSAKAFKGFAAAMFKAFPDVRASYTPLVARGDKIAVIGAVSGTHKGAFFGMKPTGRKIKWTEMHVFRIRNGRIAEHWVQADMFGIVQQIRAPAKKK
ncbi:MAG TPA: ester cyclase [Alphaproteobacteria bacterium]|nr:ester cyclase [Alphaproteobacteria bacterium]